MCTGVVGVTSGTVRVSGWSLAKAHYYKLVVYANTFRSETASAEYVFVASCSPQPGTCHVTPTSGPLH